MFSDAFFGRIALLYYLGCLLLLGLVSFIALQGRRRPRTHAQLRRTFFGLALCLLLWQLTLFLEVRITRLDLQLWLGRLNFTAVALASFLAWRFVREVAASGTRAHTSPVTFRIRAETGLMAAATLLTPLLSAMERVEGGQALTTFGPLFPVYLLHVVGYWGAALVVAFRERRRVENKKVRRQLSLIGIGMLCTGGISLVTNALLPYGFGNFRYCDVGTLSTLFFVLTVAYATLLHGLFDLRQLLRETLVYGILLAFVLGAYSSTVFLVTQYLTGNADKLTQFAVLLIAFSVDPLRRFLEKKADRLLFGTQEVGKEEKKRMGSRKNTVR